MTIRLQVWQETIKFDDETADYDSYSEDVTSKDFHEFDTLTELCEFISSKAVQYSGDRSFYEGGWYTGSVREDCDYFQSGIEKRLTFSVSGLSLAIQKAVFNAYAKVMLFDFKS